MTKKERKIIDEFWMNRAKKYSQRSTCFSRRIGGVLVDEIGNLISVGWNGPPEEIGLCHERNPNKEKTCPRKLLNVPSGEKLELCLAIHAEVRCVLRAALIGKSTKNSTLFINCGIPCKNCLVALIGAGITRIVCNKKGSKTGNFEEIFYDKESKYVVRKSNLVIDFVEV